MNPVLGADVRRSYLFTAGDRLLKVPPFSSLTGWWEQAFLFEVTTNKAFGCLLTSHRV